MCDCEIYPETASNTLLESFGWFDSRILRLVLEVNVVVTSVDNVIHCMELYHTIRLTHGDLIWFWSLDNLRGYIYLSYTYCSDLPILRSR